MLYNFSMSNKKEEKPLSLQPTEEEIESQNLTLASQSLEEQARTKLKPEMIRLIKKIAYYTAKVGLPLNEACLLVDIDYDKFQEEMKLEPLIKKIITMKELEYKKDLLHVLTQKARSGDDKLAQWLLEKKFPDEYGDKKKPQGNGNEDIIFEAIQFIRRNGDNNPLVSETSGKALIVKKSSQSKGVYERIGDILGEPTSLPSTDTIKTFHGEDKETELVNE